MNRLCHVPRCRSLLNPPGLLSASGAKLVLPLISFCSAAPGLTVVFFGLKMKRYEYTKSGTEPAQIYGYTL